MPYFKRALYTTPYLEQKHIKPSSIWHVLDTRDGRTLTAKCGYSHNFEMETPRIVSSAFNLMICKRCEPREKVDNKVADEPLF